MRYLASLSIAALLFGASAPLVAQDISKDERRQAVIESRKAVVDSDTNAENIKKVTTELKWHDDLGDARKLAKKQDKLVFWIQALGDVDGYV